MTATPARAELPQRLALGESFIPRDRYTSQAFFDLEMEHLWPRAWQLACREEQVAQPGDYHEYQIGDQSILVSRDFEGALHAWFNTCPHRGTRLARGCGRFEGRHITCPYHGWAWNLRGENTFVLHRDDFSAEALAPERLRLRECRLGTWGGFVWINMDPAAPSLEDSLRPITQHLDAFGLDRMSVLWHKVVRLPVNWKAALDAFIESYHVPTVHPEYASLGTDSTRFVYYQDAGGHSHYSLPPTTGDDVDVPDGVDEAERFYRYVDYNVRELGAMYTERDREIAARVREEGIPAGSSADEEYMKRLYALAAETDIPLPQISPAQFAHMGPTLVFPHFFCIPTVGNCLAYRARPEGLDPHRTLWDVWSLTMQPAAEAPLRDEPVEVDYRDEAAVGRVLHQDFGNLEEFWAGLQSRACEGLNLNPVQESGIFNMHREIDRYVTGR